MESFGKLLQGMASLAWPIFIAAFIFNFRHNIKEALSELIARIREGGAFEIWQLKFERIERVAEVGQPVQESEVGRVVIQTNPALQQEIIKKQEDERFTFLVHYTLPLKRDHNSYDVILYVAGHFNHLENVNKVDYFLGQGWGNAVFVCTDRTRQFAIKVSAVGSFLSMARIYFGDGTIITQSRFIDLPSLN
ncbi:MAG: pYEATS domain-containing protein [Rhodopila sp.]